MKEAVGSFYLTVFDSFQDLCAIRERMHMLVIYTEYQGPFMFGLEMLNSRKNTRFIQVCFPQLSLRAAMSVADFQNRILT